MAANPGTVRSESIRFLENTGNVAGGNAGVWSGSFEVPVGAVLIDVLVHGTALWTATTSATLIVGDATDDDGFYTAVDLKATDLLAAESLSFANPAGQFGADLVYDYSTVAGIGASYIKRRMLAAARTLSAKVTTVGTPVTTRPGDTTVVFVYAYPAPISASFVSA